jgi:hypothetical protein
MNEINVADGASVYLGYEGNFSGLNSATRLLAASA